MLRPGAGFFLVLGLACTVRAEPVTIGPAGFDVLGYEVELEIDRENRRVSGQEWIRLRSTSERLSAIRFPRNGIDVASVETESGAKLAHSTDKDRIEIRLSSTLTRREEIAVLVTYAATEPRDVVFGDEAIYTGFDTCHWMVCREESGDKALFSVRMSVPEGFTLVASGDPVRRARPGGRGGRQTWTERLPTSPYLFGFALGRFSVTSRVHRGVTLQTFTLGKDEAWVQQAFADDGQMLDFFVEKAGRSFPRKTYRQIVVPGKAAQEKSSFSLLGDDYLDARVADPSEDWLVAHEMAHQFWGNLVTCADWSHFWLNEGITTFMVAAYKERRWGREAYERELELLRARHQVAIDAQFDVPLTYAGVYPSLRLKRAITYSKGALFLARLRQAMGERAFWTALGRYTRRFSGRVATTRDLERIFLQATNHDLSVLFETWVHGSPP